VGKVLQVFGNEKISVANKSGFQKLVIVGILTDFERAGDLNKPRAFADQAKECSHSSRRDSLRSRQNAPVFVKSGLGIYPFILPLKKTPENLQSGAFAIG